MSLFYAARSLLTRAGRLQQQYPVAVPIVILSRRRKLLRTIVGKWAAGDILVGPAGGIEPLGLGFTSQARHVDCDYADSGNIHHDCRAVVRLRGSSVVTLAYTRVDIAEGSEARGEDLMILVGNQVLPGHRGKELCPDTQLLYAGGVDLALPAIGERPGVLVAVPLSDSAAERGPVVLLAQHVRRSEVGRRSYVLPVVMRLDHDHRRDRLLVVAVQHLDVGGGIRVGAVEFDQRNPARIIEGRTRAHMQFHGLYLVGRYRANPLGDRLHQVVVLRDGPHVEVIPVEPGDVGVALVAVAQVLAVGGCGLHAVVTEGGQPADRLDGVNEDQQMVLRGQLNDVIEAREVRLVRLAQVVVGEVGAPGNVAIERL